MTVRKKRTSHPRAGKSLQRPKKKATNVMLHEELLAKARKLRINMSAVFETAMIQAIKEAEQKQWLDENEEAIKYLNAWVARRGLFSDGLRRF